MHRNKFRYNKTN